MTGRLADQGESRRLSGITGLVEVGSPLRLLNNLHRVSGSAWPTGDPAARLLVVGLKLQYCYVNIVQKHRKMGRARIVLETSGERKTALVEAASLQGATLTDWFEEEVAGKFGRVARHASEELQEITSVDELEDPRAVFESLSYRDWSFTEDDTSYLTHDLHPYPAKFIPQIPAHLIARLSMPGDMVLDPFGGSATTAVEAVRLGRRSISFDANPLSALIGRVKTGYMASDVRTDLDQLCAAIDGHIISFDAREREWASHLTDQYGRFLPDIPNVAKWFEDYIVGELCLVRHLIEETTAGLARDAACLALSRVIIRISNQESETRYVSVPKQLRPTIALRAYLESLKAVARRLEQAAVELQFADARYLVGDSRYDLTSELGENCIDLIVTSPPYPNATDYHLYHRFRLFWLGFDPRALGKIEIGSHLRHQRNETGFEEYQEDIALALDGCFRVLAPGRYAVFVVGDAVFKGRSFSTSDAIARAARDVGFEVLGAIERPIHRTKRSFAKPARRARREQLVVLKRPNRPLRVHLNPPAYRMWPYEGELRVRETECLIGEAVDAGDAEKPIAVELTQPALWQLRRLTFTRDLAMGNGNGEAQPTWQRVLENGNADPAKRKDPKYVTHGLHAFKGKFYPQLVKSLLNCSGVPVGGSVLDPYCGSGTTLLEGMLNGFRAYGCDFNPLAAKIAHAKTGVLTVSREVVDLAIRTLLYRVSHRRGDVPVALDQFPATTHDELTRWFPLAVLHKLNWLLGQARLLGTETLVGFFEVIVSSLIREVSQQDPTDLRIRRRKTPLDDAPVLEMFEERLGQQHSRLQKYWTIAGRQPGRLVPPKVVQGDSRKHGSMESLGLGPNSVDCVVTSPPYATALPYIDTDRLSLLAILGMPSGLRSDLEEQLTGSREIRRSAKDQAEADLLDVDATQLLPDTVVTSVRDIYHANRSADVGFRRANMAALLWRYFCDMKQSMAVVANVLRPGAKAFYVVGDSRTKAGGNWVTIETTGSIGLIGEQVGLRETERIDIDVTTENFRHIKNAITKNQIIVFERS